VIAIDTPKENDVNTSWGPYRIGVDALEAVTGKQASGWGPLLFAECLLEQQHHFLNYKTNQ
jgi:hypothetical protein